MSYKKLADVHRAMAPEAFASVSSGSAGNPPGERPAAQGAGLPQEKEAIS
jgi:hypothetical protein